MNVNIFQKYHKLIENQLNKQSKLIVNANRETLIKNAVASRECIISKNGTLATWSADGSTGRSPKDTVFVRRAHCENFIDWKSANNLPLDPEIFEMVFEDSLKYISEYENIYVNDRVVGADSKYALPVRVVTDRALTSLFTDNMFRKIPADLNNSCFAEKPFYLIALPYNKLDSERYKNKLRTLPNGETSDKIVLLDLDARIGIVIGTSYLGSCKKLIFTVMNYYLLFENVLPLHCSANEGDNGRTALILGLSGTGKTTLSADPHRKLLGDDEHGWSTDGVANFENGCYAKMINISPKKEPEIYNAVLHQDDYLKHGAIVENAMIYPDGTFDFDDSRLTENSRASYPLSFLTNIKESSVGGHPTTILFLTADANGVLPLVSKLDQNQAMLWFLMGYTSKLAGTETSVIEPQSTFSRFFGAPFMPGLPETYAKMLGDKMKEFNVSVFLINTGWYGGKYGVGKRIELKYTRAMVNAALNGELENVDYVYNNLFHLWVPTTCPNVPSNILQPENTWENKEEYDKISKALALEFSINFDKSYDQNNIAPEIVKNCPGK